MDRQKDKGQTDIQRQADKIKTDRRTDGRTDRKTKDRQTEATVKRPEEICEKRRKVARPFFYFVAFLSIGCPFIYNPNHFLAWHKSQTVCAWQHGRHQQQYLKWPCVFEKCCSARACWGGGGRQATSTINISYYIISFETGLKSTINTQND